MELYEACERLELAIDRMHGDFTLRDYFAAHAITFAMMQSIERSNEPQIKLAAQFAYTIADAMLAERDRLVKRTL